MIQFNCTGNDNHDYFIDSENESKYLEAFVDALPGQITLEKLQRHIYGWEPCDEGRSLFHELLMDKTLLATINGTKCIVGEFQPSFVDGEDLDAWEERWNDRIADVVDHIAKSLKGNPVTVFDAPRTITSRGAFGAWVVIEATKATPDLMVKVYEAINECEKF